jgi:hypothetical protein
MSSHTKRISQQHLRDKFLINSGTIPEPNTWRAIYDSDLTSVTKLQEGLETPPIASWAYNAQTSYLLKDLGDSVYQRINGATNRIFRRIQWLNGNKSDTLTGYICVFSLDGATSPFVRTN